MRITNTPGTYSGHYYASARAFNADSSVVWLAFSSRFIDTATGQSLPWTAPGGGAVKHWNPVNPKEMITVSNSAVTVWNASTSSVVKTISLAPYTTGGSEPSATVVRANPSMNGRMAIKALNASGKPVLLGVDLVTNEVKYFGTYAAYNYVNTYVGEHKDRTALASVSGRYMLMFGYRGSEYHSWNAFDWDTGAMVLASAATGGQNIESPGAHGDMGLDANGDDIMTGTDKIRWTGVVSVHIPSGVRTTTTGPIASHTSGGNYSVPGWAVFSSYGDLYSHIGAYKSDGSGYVYLIDPNNRGNVSYWASTIAAVSPNGRYIVYTSGWNGTRSGDSYLADLWG